MKEHTITWYEADDGTIFVDESEAEHYELNKLYQASGVRLYIGKELVKEFDYSGKSNFASETENKVTRMTIDRSKEKENEEFLELYDALRGCCFIGDALHGKIDAYGAVRYPSTPVLGTEYVETPQKKVPGFRYPMPVYDTDFVCRKQLNTCPVCGEKKILSPCKHKVNEWKEHSNSWVCDECRKEKRLK